MSETKRERTWKQKYNKLQSFLMRHGHVNVHASDDRSLYTWIYTQRRSYRHGTLSHDKVESLERLGLTWAISGRKRAVSTDDSVLERNSTPPQDAAAAQCLLFMSRTSLKKDEPITDYGESSEEDLDEENSSEQSLDHHEAHAAHEDEQYREKHTVSSQSNSSLKQYDINDLESIDLPFCQKCKANKSFKEHHVLCPKSGDAFNREKLVKILLGVNVGCNPCLRQFQYGAQNGRHEAHSKHCTRNSNYIRGAKKPSVQKENFLKTAAAKVVRSSGVVTVIPKSSRSYMASASDSARQRPVVSETLLKAKAVRLAREKVDAIHFKRSSAKEWPVYTISPDAESPIFSRATSFPSSLMVPDMVSTSNNVCEENRAFFPPLITVDTFDVDALIHDLSHGKVETAQALERLQKIRRLAL